MNSSPSPYLKVTRPASIQRGISRTSSCSTFTHSTGPIPAGKTKVSGSLNGSVVYHSPAALPHDRRVQALLDRRPDGERRGELVALDHQVRAVADADLVDGREQPVGRVAGEHVRQPGLDPDAAQRQQPAALPLAGERELLVTQLDPRLPVRVGRVRAGQRHRHVEVGDPGGEGRAEDRHHEPRVDRVQHRIAPLGSDQLHDRLLVRRVELYRGEPVATPGDRPPRPLLVVIGHDDALEQIPPRDRSRDRRPDSARADDQHPHDAPPDRLPDDGRLPGRPTPQDITARRTGLGSA